MRHIMLLIVWITVAGLSHSAEAQQPGRIYQVGVLTVGNPVLQIKGIRDGLTEIGYKEGKNLVLDISPKENYEELRPIAKAYVEKKFGSSSLSVAHQH